MSYELNTYQPSGLTITATLRSGLTDVAAGIALPERTPAGYYSGSVPAGVPAGTYDVLAISSGVVVATGTIRWDGSAEVQPGAGAGDVLAKLPSQYTPGQIGALIGKLDVGPVDAPVIVLPDPPAEVGVCRLVGYLETPNNRPAVNARVVFRLVTPAAVASERLIYGREVVVFCDRQGRLADGAGNPWVDLQRNDKLQPAGSTWHVTCEQLGVSEKSITLIAPTMDLRVLLLG